MTQPEQKHPGRTAQMALTVGALGVVFGDIGTSPLYTMRECIAHLPPIERTEGILGILSLMFWSLTAVVTLKYLVFVMRADNRGEGGIFALLALSRADQPRGATRGIGVMTLIILFGAALLYGDGIITPAISVLGAAEGFTSLSDHFTPFVKPIACVILALLFLFQPKGTKTIGGVFGPVMLVWFAVLALLGIWHVAQAPGVLAALNPLKGLRLLTLHPHYLIPLLGVIVLTITGTEALYADMGHFGRRAIARAWLAFAFPALVLNYFGEGAYAITHPTATDNPFFALAPDGLPRLLLIVLSIIAAVIASQALISGTYSLTRQAIQLGYFPRLTVLHTNPDQRGQIYMPLVNAALAFGSIAMVLGFRSTSNLAGAYGIAVTGTMAVTTLALYLVMVRNWRWPVWRALPLCLVFLIIDVAFFCSNLHKFAAGGWLPLAAAVVVLAIMHTWKSGRTEIQEKVYSGAINELELSMIARSKSIVRVPGSAVFMAASPKGVPLALLHHLKSNKCLQQTTVLLTISFEEIPQVPPAERLVLTNEGEGVWRAVGYYGYMESPDVGALCEELKARGVPLKPQEVTFYFNREMIISGGNARMWEWQKAFYAFLSRNARPVKDYYKVLPTQVIEIGLPVQL
ncbi:MAG: KUP/HAK/KT family potassium transporter [Opitutaceae bacterium]|nr:KUP/HAK/KT family potassium transporter [Opitutaceae bacterium]